jgi:hypothetical protein
MELTIEDYRKFLRTNINYYYKDNGCFRNLQLLGLVDAITIEQVTDEMLIDFIKEDVGWYYEPGKLYTQEYSFPDGRKFSARLEHGVNSSLSAKEQTVVKKL